MKLSDLLKDVPVLEMNVDPGMEIAGVSYDSRRVQPGHMFVAITGYAADGHQYSASASPWTRGPPTSWSPRPGPPWPCWGPTGTAIRRRR